MLGKIRTLLAQLREDDLGVILDIFERLVSQQKKGETKFLYNLKQLLRSEVKSFFVPCSETPFSTRFSRNVSQHLTQPDCEFDKDNFELVPCKEGVSIKDFHNSLISSGKMPVNCHFVTFFDANPKAFPNDWKDTTILVTGTWYEDSTRFYSNEPSVCEMRYSNEHSLFYSVSIRLTDPTHEQQFVLCYKTKE